MDLAIGQATHESMESCTALDARDKGGPLFVFMIRGMTSNWEVSQQHPKINHQRRGNSSGRVIPPTREACNPPCVWWTIAPRMAGRSTSKPLQTTAGWCLHKVRYARCRHTFSSERIYFCRTAYCSALNLRLSLLSQTGFDHPHIRPLDIGSWWNMPPALTSNRSEV